MGIFERRADQRFSSTRLPRTGYPPLKMLLPRLLLSGLLCGHLIPVGARAADRLASAVPETTLFLLSTDDFQNVSGGWQASSWGRMLNSSQFDPLRAFLASKQSASLLNIEPWLGLNWEKLGEFQGAAGLAYVAEDRKGGWVLFLSLEGNEARVDDCLRVAQAYFGKQKAKIRKETMEGHEATVVEQKRSPAGTAEMRVFLKTDRWLLIGDSLEGVRIAARPPGAATLAQSAPYRDVRALMEERFEAATGNIDWFLRPLELWAAIDSAPKNRRKGEKDVRAAMRKMGFRAVQAAGGVARVDKDQPLEYQGAILAPGAYRDAMKMLELMPIENTNPPAWIPADTAFYLSASWDFRVAMRAIGLLFSEIDSPGAETAFEDALDGLAQEVDGPRVDVRKEIFDQLDPQFLSLTRYDPSIADKQNPIGKRSMWVCSPKETDRMRKTITRLLKNETNVGVREAGDASLWSSNNGLGILADQAPIQGILCAESLLLISSTSDDLRPLLGKRETERPLVDSEAYRGFQRRCADWRADDACVRQLGQPEFVMRPLLDALASNQPLQDAAMPVRMLRFLLIGDYQGELPDKLVPRFEQFDVIPAPLAGLAWREPDKGGGSAANRGFTMRGAVINTQP
ncbi:MAG: hypothetical protein FJ295_07975 [Planctomycetes bacterium]|nr:hypothetical protein [Planctomycetota bacterium]